MISKDSGFKLVFLILINKINTCDLNIIIMPLVDMKRNLQ